MSGCTSTSAVRQRRHVFANTIQNSRSRRPRYGRAPTRLKAFELLAECEVLKDQLVMSAAGQPDRTNKDGDHV